MRFTIWSKKSSLTDSLTDIQAAFDLPFRCLDFLFLVSIICWAYYVPIWMAIYFFMHLFLSSSSNIALTINNQCCYVGFIDYCRYCRQGWWMRYLYSCISIQSFECKMKIYVIDKSVCIPIQSNIANKQSRLTVWNICHQRHFHELDFTKWFEINFLWFNNPLLKLNNLMKS